MCQLQRVIGYSSIYRIYRGASSTAVQAIEVKIYSFTIEMNWDWRLSLNYGEIWVMGVWVIENQLYIRTWTQNCPKIFQLDCTCNISTHSATQPRQAKAKISKNQNDDTKPKAEKKDFFYPIWKLTDSGTRHQISAAKPRRKLLKEVRKGGPTCYELCLPWWGEGRENSDIDAGPVGDQKRSRNWWLRLAGEGGCQPNWPI